MAKRLGKQVLRTKIDVKLDPLPADERKVIHQTISEMGPHLKTESQEKKRKIYDNFIC